MHYWWQHGVSGYFFWTQHWMESTGLGDGFLLQMFQEFFPTILEGNSLSPATHTLAGLAGLMEMCNSVWCVGTGDGSGKGVVLIFPFPSEGFWLRREAK